MINILHYLNPFSEDFILLKLWSFLVDIISYINPFSDNFLGKKIASLFGDLLKSLFVPGDTFFSDEVEHIKSQLAEKIPYEDYINTFETIKQVESGEDIQVSLNNYKIFGDFSISLPSFVNFSFITKYKNTWYAWVRGFLYVFLIIYNLNQIMKLFRGFNIGDGSSTGGSNVIPGQISLFGGGKK